MANEESLSDSKLYEMAVNIRKITEERRDEINKFYITLFSAFIPVMSFVGGSDNRSVRLFFSDKIDLFLILLSLIGLFLSVNWISVLTNIMNYQLGIEKFMAGIEKKYNKKFIAITSYYLKDEAGSAKITKYEKTIPYLFATIFGVLLAGTLLFQLFIK